MLWEGASTSEIRNLEFELVFLVWDRKRIRRSMSELLLVLSISRS